LELEGVPELIHQCGKDPTNDELLYFARLCVLGPEDPITFDAFATAVEKTTEFVSQDPYEVCKVAIERVMDRRATHIKSNEFKGLLMEYEKMLSPKEIEYIENEVAYLPTKNGETSTDAIARMIRDSIEGLPR